MPIEEVLGVVGRDSKEGGRITKILGVFGFQIVNERKGKIPVAVFLSSLQFYLQQEVLEKPVPFRIGLGSFSRRRECDSE